MAKKQTALLAALILAYSANPLFAQTAAMGAPIIFEKHLQGRVLAARWTQEPAAADPRYRIANDARYLAVEIEVRNLRGKEQKLEYDELALAVSFGGASYMLGGPIQLFSNDMPIWGYETKLPPGFVHVFTAIFALNDGIDQNLFLCFDDDGEPRSALTIAP